MKMYIKPEIEIVEFDVIDITTGDKGSYITPPFELEGNGAFYGIEAGEEGYLVN